ncbi:D-2-hydroxyacid dehydrogenase [Propionivibrio dicarboxylicus]|uniref:Glycerate dehydrogenase n=1 Tax=Propionivibrio dicarboxylicus TaxID=83767 RepID=A0A1G8JVT8_9RHOO|nr:D-2-hydroxyacid dehydrogenase [Propionivibrio dicarboxylicus]SDI35332.1 glycerate dehydrogenase [Propionivibrio dicarboxylicus]
MKIVVLDGYTLNPGDLSWSGIEQFGEVVVHDRTAPEQIMERLAGAEIVFTNKTPLTREHFAANPQLRFVGVLATGYNVVDIVTAKERKIPVCNIPTYGTMAVAQFAAALMLELCHRVGRHADSVKAGDWSRGNDFCYWLNPLIELDGKTLGVVGFGRIGQAFGRIAQAFGMKIIAVDEYPNKALESATLRYGTLDELYAEADVISLHCPLFDNNKGMINKSAIAKMKPGVLILNTSRGPLINEADLAEALAAGKVAGAGVDVLSSEPPALTNPLLSAPNCIVTPHIAWATKEARSRLMDIATDNLAAFLKGAPKNVVNP